MSPSLADYSLAKPNQRVSMFLAFAGILIPGLHKFYLKQWRWGLVYLLLSVTHIPQVASLIEGIWFLSQSTDEFNRNFNRAAPESTAPPEQAQSGADGQPGTPAGLEIDVNRASVEDWLKLPGISVHQARSLTELTQAGVQFHCLEDVAAALNVPLQQLHPWEPLLKFYYYGDSLPDSRPVSVNTASLEALAKVPGISPELAQAIVQERDGRGSFLTLVDLQQRLDLSPSLLGDLIHYLRV